MTKIKLVHVTSSLAVGGAEKVLYLLVKELARYNFQQVVFYFHAGPYVQQLQQLGVKTVCITGRWYRYDLFFFVRLLQALHAERPDVIHSLLWAANVSARLCAKLLGVPVVSVYHNNVDQDGFLRSFFDRLTLFCATRVVAVSQQVKESIVMRSAIDGSSVAVITNGIQINQIVPCIGRSQLGLPEDVFVIGTVGRLVSVKRFDYLISACAHMRGVHLVIIGAGPLYQTLLDQVISERLHNVSIIQHVNALHYYALFDCFVQPSLKEGISLALLEAMSWAKPCIVIGADGYHPVVTHGHDGLIVLPHDQKAMSDAVWMLQHDLYCRQRLGNCAKQSVKLKFSVEQMVQAYRQMFDQYALGESLTSVRSKL